MRSHLFVGTMRDLKVGRGSNETWMNGSKHEHASHLQHGLPKNHPIEKENYLPSASNFWFHDVPCVNFPVCSSPTEMGPLAVASGLHRLLYPFTTGVK